MKNHNYFVYMLTNNSGMLYIGVTNNLERRIYEHKQKLIPGFSEKYKFNKLIYFEQSGDINACIAREKQLKGWRRSKKLSLILQLNPKLKDLDPSTGSG